MTKVRSALRKSPYRNLLPLIVKLNVEKSGCFMIAAINGVIRSFTKELTTAVKAAPIMTPTARSTTLPRRIKFLNPLIIFLYYLIAQLLAHFLDIFLYFFDVLLYFFDVLGLLIDSHLYEYRQIYRLERNNRSEYEQHAVHVDKPGPRRAETYRKQKCMHADGLGRAYPARSRAGGFFNIYFHGCLQRIGLWSPVPQTGALPLSYRHHTFPHVYSNRVPGRGLAPPRLATHAPQACLATKLQHPGVYKRSPTILSIFSIFKRLRV